MGVFGRRNQNIKIVKKGTSKARISTTEPETSSPVAPETPQTNAAAEKPGKSVPSFDGDTMLNMFIEIDKKHKSKNENLENLIEYKKYFLDEDDSLSQKIKNDFKEIFKKKPRRNP